ncbi:hypothetical protein [Plebeiibacterium sediminum]|uniref:Uncharacterized protein n=1 Tax=Plebeiibacterium sediminum TaxID=2992112 RepID=A0AAE3M237_9BACT|nr:hypothetical protein [Plebeiobacterium sediminum]MCW3785876.1 hypothetical protein [Plebeiobacterium sediminum]
MEKKNVIIGLKAVKKGDEIVLHLKDNEGNDHDKSITSEVEQGGTVTWKLMDNSDIKEIVNIYKKSDSQDVFSTDPQPVNGSTDWAGVISKTAKGTESYNIDFIYKDGNKVTDDPEIIIKPPK